MEDLSSRWTLELEKSSDAFLKSPLSSHRTFDFHKTQHLDNFEISFNMRDFLSKPVPTPFDPCELLSDHKEDSFILEPSTHLDIDRAHEVQNEESTVQLDSCGENRSLLRPQDYDLDCYQIRRSRGPSFDVECEKGEGEEVYSGDINFAKYFHDHGGHILSRISGNTNFIECPQNTVNIDEHVSVPQDFEEISSHDPTDDVLSSQDIQKIASITEKSIYDSYTQKSSCPSENSFSTTEDISLTTKKQRRKSYNSKAKRTSKAVSKVRKPKKEATKPVFALTPKAHSLSIKLTKISESEQSTSSTLLESLINKQLSCKSQPSIFTEELKVKEEFTEQSFSPEKNPPKAIEAQPSSSTTAAMLSISQSLREQKFENIDGLFQGLDLPPEVHELISKSKIFSKAPLFCTKKIGTLTVEERRSKVERYLQKRKDRTWTKKINYDCRKKVADTRLRFKGRFVTRSQVFSIFEEEGIHLDPSRTTEEEIKILLEERFGTDPEKIRIREREENIREDRIEKRIKKSAITQTKRE